MHRPALRWQNLLDHSMKAGARARAMSNGSRGFALCRTTLARRGLATSSRARSLPASPARANVQCHCMKCLGLCSKSRPRTGGVPRRRTISTAYLLMPDPRHIYGGGEIIIGYKDGHSDRFSEYGHRPWDSDFQNKKREEREWGAMEKFKAE